MSENLLLDDANEKDAMSTLIHGASTWEMPPELTVRLSLLHNTRPVYHSRQDHSLVGLPTIMSSFLAYYLYFMKTLDLTSLIYVLLQPSHKICIPLTCLLITKEKLFLSPQCNPHKTHNPSTALPEHTLHQGLPSRG